VLTTLSCVGDAPAEPSATLPSLSAVSATAPSPTEVLLTWSPPASADVQESRIERAEGASAFAGVATLASNVTTYRDAGLTPATTYRYRLRACGEGGCSRYAMTSVRTLATLLVVTESLPDAAIGRAYSGTLAAGGGALGYAWSLASGALPEGLTLSEAGIISGTPRGVETRVFLVEVRSADGQSATRELALRVLEAVPGPPVTISTTRLPPALRGSVFDASLEVSGGTPGDLAWNVVDGSLPPGLSLAAGGTFSGSPSDTGSFSFTVGAESGGRTAERAFTLEVVANDGERFDITAFEVAPVPEEVRPHLEAAIERWERVISGDLATARIPQRFFTSTHCSGFGRLLNGTSADDLIVMVDISPIDGAGNILGQAGPCGARANRLPFAGVLILDSSDLAARVGTETLTDLFFHEIGHILGFGAIWGAAGLLTGAGTWDPRFIGPLAREQMRELGAAGDVPVENVGAWGTVLVHWRESVFRTEIMTGYAERTGTPMPLSRVTIASMGDLGYDVDVTEADEYTLPVQPAPPSFLLETSGYDVVLPGPVKVLPDAPPGG
jgi:hypothetical protein